MELKLRYHYNGQEELSQSRMDCINAHRSGFICTKRDQDECKSQKKLSFEC
jgi:hypothetical protein